MSRKLDIASVISIALTLGVTVFSADQGAMAESRNPQPLTQTPAAQIEVAATAAQSPTVQSGPDNLLPAVYPTPAVVPAEPVQSGSIDHAPKSASTHSATLSLADMVADEISSEPVSAELECLAGAIYFEAKSETLEGQLAVGRVVINRARSGRFPGSYCGVVYQRSQFSFVRGNAMPPINRASRDWKEAVAIARIADEGAYNSSVEGALFFHAARVSPGWRLTRIARVDNHIFYR
jgi:Cell wall hydrolyses involved in spore germination